MKKFLFTAAALLAFVHLGAQQTPDTFNRYGHRIVKTGDVWQVADPSSLDDFTSRPDTIPGFNAPWKYVNDKIQPRDYGKCVTREFIYKSYPGYDLKLYIDIPSEPADEPTPYVVLIHGGGWISGSPSSANNSRIGAYLAGQGIATVRVAYSLAPYGTFPDTVADIRDAVAFVKDRAWEFNIDPDRLGFTGNSAGGTLCAYMAMTYPGTKAVASLCGGYEMRTHFARLDGKRPADKQAMLQDYFILGTDSLNFVKFSPVNNIPAAKDIPAVLLLHGTFDNMVVYGQSVIFLNALLGKGAAKAELRTLPYVPHSLFSTNVATHEDDLIYVARFFKENL